MGWLLYDNLSDIKDCVKNRVFIVGQKDLWQAKKTQNKTYG